MTMTNDFNVFRSYALGLGPRVEGMTYKGW